MPLFKLKVMMALTLIIGIVTIIQPTWSLSEWQRYSRQRSLAIAHLEQTGTCSGAGHLNCCMMPASSCSVPQGSSNPLCYCDQGCFTYHDCCPDIPEIGCPAPAGFCVNSPNITNGQITYKDYSDPPSYKLLKQERSVAIYKCNDGYFLNGPESRVCQQGSWSGRLPSCISKDSISCRVVYPNTGCTTNPNAPLLGPGGSNPHQCSCHASCFTNASDVDCCEDIGCVPETCSQAGLSPGGCDWSDNSCFVQGGECHCDSQCRHFNDCCSDVRTNSKMTTTLNSDRQKIKEQSFIGRPPTLVQITSRGDQARISATRKLASEFRSMTQELIDTEQRWNEIAEELESIQKKIN